MSETAQRYSTKKPQISAQVEIGEYFEAVAQERAEFLAFLEFDSQFSLYDDRYEDSFSERLETPSANALFLDMCYDMECEQEREKRMGVLERAHPYDLELERVWQAERAEEELRLLEP